jgi:hypothetical protein
MSGAWTSKAVCTVIAPSLCTPVILGLLFLVHNNIAIDHTDCMAIDKISDFDLLHPKLPDPLQPPKMRLKEFICKLKKDCKLLVTNLNMVCQE